MAEITSGQKPKNESCCKNKLSEQFHLNKTDTTAPMKSMTGYGRGTATDTKNRLQIEVEMTSVNRKNLDIQISCPRDWNGLDQQCRLWIKDTFQRGRLNIQLKVESTETATSGFAWNPESVDNILEQLRSYAESRGIDFQVNSQLLLNLAKTLKEDTSLPDWHTLPGSIQSAFDQALTELDAMRSREGKALADDFTQRIQVLDSIRKQIAEHARSAVPNYQTALMTRLKQLKLDLDIDDERVLKEIALFADRCDISEELTRLNSHFEQFREFILGKGPIGRKMDFLCQEINREFNTIGSKVTLIESTRAVIEAKNELERIREQVQNIE